MLRTVLVFLCSVQFLVASHCRNGIKIRDGYKCPVENLTDWLDNEIVLLKDPPALTADESFDRFYFIDITATPLLPDEKKDPIETEVCVAFSAVDFLSSDSIIVEFSSLEDPSQRYRITNNLMPKNPERIRQILKDPPISNLGCYRISDLFAVETNEIDPTVQLKIKSAKNHNRRLTIYSEFYFKLPHWHKEEDGGKFPDNCQPEPFIYVNFTYRILEKIIVKWMNCSSVMDLKISKHDESTNQQIWVENIPDWNTETPYAFWQIKPNNLSRFYYKAEVIRHLENSIPMWDELKKNR